MKSLKYKGYIALMEPDIEDGIIVGRVINTRDIIAFDGKTIPEAIESFHSVVDEYLEDCVREEKEPDKPYSGKFNLRIPPQLHGKIAAVAMAEGKSLNQWVADILDRAVNN